MRFALMWTMCVLLSSCAFARGQHEMLDTANLVPPVTVKNAESVRIYRAGTIPEKGCLRVARLAAHGNGNATRATLESKLQDEAQEVGSDAVVILDQEVTKSHRAPQPAPMAAVLRWPPPFNFPVSMESPVANPIFGSGHDGTVTIPCSM